MLAARSGIVKMVKNNSFEREINSMPRPFISSATNNSQINFSPITYEVCKYITSSMSISKVILVGDVAVGKTSLVNRFCHRIFETNYKATIGVDFEVERFKILNVYTNLQIWDTAGQERFKCIAQSYYRGANAIILVFSLCDPLSLEHTRTWLNEALKPNHSSPLIFLVGTKRDQLTPSSYMCIEDEAIKIANELKAEYWAVSSKTGDCVNNFFNRLAALTFDISAQNDYNHKMERIILGNPMALGKTMNIKKRKQSCDGKCK